MIVKCKCWNQNSNTSTCTLCKTVKVNEQWLKIQVQIISVEIIYANDKNNWIPSIINFFVVAPKLTYFQTLKITLSNCSKVNRPWLKVQDQIICVEMKYANAYTTANPIALVVPLKLTSLQTLTKCWRRHQHLKQ